MECLHSSNTLGFGWPDGVLAESIQLQNSTSGMWPISSGENPVGEVGLADGESYS